MWYDPIDDYIDEFTAPPLEPEIEELTAQLEELKQMEENGLDDFFEEDILNESIREYYPRETQLQKNHIKTFYTKAVGVTYGNRQRHILTLKVGEELKLIHEKNNRYDSNALLITTASGLDVGYINKDQNKDLLEKLKNNQIKSISVANVTGDGYANRGVNIKVEVYDVISSTNIIPKTKPEVSDNTSVNNTNIPSTNIEDVPWGCISVIAIIIIILIIGLSGGISS